MKIEEIDPAFQTKTIGVRPVVYLDVMKPPFAVEGQPWPAPPGQPWRVARIPPYLTPREVNEGALDEGWHMTTGAAVRFRSDSPFVAIRAILSHSCDMNHMPRCGSAGFDLYARVEGHWLHAGTVQPSRDQVDLEQLVFTRDVEDTGMKDYILDLPLYGGVDAISIGLSPDAIVEAPPPMRTARSSSTDPPSRKGPAPPIRAPCTAPSSAGSSTPSRSTWASLDAPAARSRWQRSSRG